MANVSSSDNDSGTPNTAITQKYKTPGTANQWRHRALYFYTHNYIRPLLSETFSNTLVRLGMIAAIAFASCSADRKADNDTVTFKRLRPQKAYSLKGSAVDFETPADQSYGLQVQLLMPENMFGKDIAALRDSILDAAFDTTGTDLNTMIERTAAKISRENGYTLADTVLPDSVVRDTPRFTARASTASTP